MKAFKPLSTADQLASHLRSEIFTGSISKEMPGINLLAARLECSPRTVSAAIQLLLHEGILTKQGPGLPFLITPEKSACPPGLRVQLMLYDREESEPDMLSPWIVQIRSHLENAGHTFSIALKTLQQLGMNVGRVARYVKKTDTDAWIIASGSREVLQWFSEQPKPAFALFGRRRGLRIAGIGPDKVTAYRDVTQRLIELGHRRIILLNRPSRRLPSPGLPELAFIETLQKAGVVTGPYNMPNWDGSVGGIRRILDEMFRLTPPTAILIDESQIFLSVQHALARCGILAPEQVSLVATDQDPNFAYLRPTVAHIHYDTKPWARRIAKWADDAVIGKENRRQSLTKATFVEGGTIRPASE